MIMAAGLSAIAVMTPMPAFGVDIYNSNGFETQTFVEGQLVGQNGWIGVPPLSLGAANVATGRSKAYAGLQAVEVRGEDLAHQDFINSGTNGYYDAIGSYRRPVNYDTAAHLTPGVSIQAWVRIDGPSSPTSTNFFSASIAARVLLSDGTAGIGELAISSDGYAHGYSGNEDVPTFQTSAPVALGMWHLLIIHLDFNARTYSFFVDGIALGGPFLFPSDAGNSNSLARGSLVTYSAPDAGKLMKSRYVARYDNFAITTP